MPRKSLPGGKYCPLMPLSDPVVNSSALIISDPMTRQIHWKVTEELDLKRKSHFSFPFLSFISLTGSRSSGSNRSGSKNDTNVAAGTQESGGRSGSGSESEKREKAPSECSMAPPSEHSVHSSHTIRSVQSLVCGAPGLPPQPQTQTQTLVTAAPGSPPDRDLASVPPELTASRQSFRMAMGNPSEFFVDVMWCSSGDPEGRLTWSRHCQIKKKRCGGRQERDALTF